MTFRAHACFAASLLLAAARLSSAADFLSSAAAEKSLLEELEASSYKELRISKFERGLAPAFAALPKNEFGLLEHQTARYILHRFFVQLHGWYLKGLEPNGDTFHTTASQDALKDWVPSYLLAALEKRLDHKGLNLNDLAVLAAAIEDLTVQEAESLVESIVSQLRAQEDSGSEPSVEAAVLAYVASFLSNEFWDGEVAVRSRFRFVKEYHLWNSTRDWYKGIEQAHLQSPAEGSTNLDLIKDIAVDIGEHYGNKNDQQCRELKDALLGMWTKGTATGRVRLVDFYRMGLDTQWDLVEKKEYLHALGAIDDSNASSPLVIIPNYLTSRPNCLQATNLYEVCCRNECEDLLGHLERSIRAPEAEPGRIMEIIGVLGSETVQLPRPESQVESLATRLNDIANLHGGKVKLHGRLFAQWMHHAFPSECPFPHVAGAADPSSPDQWLGAEIELSEEERKQMVEESCSPEEAAAEWTGELPWSHEEELLHDSAAPDTFVNSSGNMGWHWKFLMIAVVGAGVGAVVALKKQPNMRDNLAAAVQKISWKQATLAALSVIGVALNLVNWALLLLIVCVGVLLPRVLSLGAQQQKKHVEKCVV